MRGLDGSALEDAGLDAVPERAPDASAPAELDAAPDAAPSEWSLEEQLRIAAHTGDLRPRPDPTNRVADLPQAARLGRKLFYFKGLSPFDIDCSFCHPPGRALSGRLTYDGHGGLEHRNPPSLLNAAAHEWFFWDGRADTMWAQAATPLESEIEMATDRVFVARAIAGEPELAGAYRALFGPLPPVEDGARFPPNAKPMPDQPGHASAVAWASMSDADRHAATTVLANVGKVLAAYERLLVVGDSAFDLFARGLEAGDAAAQAAFPPAAKRGLRLFIGEAGCATCHSGPFFTDGQFHNLGLPLDPTIPPDEGRARAIDHVLADPLNAAGVFSDDPDGPTARRLLELRPDDMALRGRIKTPSLRNVALTDPYGHDGRFLTLADLVRFKLAADADPLVGDRDPLLVPRPLGEEAIADLVAFLETLTSAPLPPELLAP